MANARQDGSSSPSAHTSNLNRWITGSGRWLSNPTCTIQSFLWKTRSRQTQTGAGHYARALLQSRISFSPLRHRHRAPTNGTIADGFSPRPADPIHSTRWNAEEFFKLTHLEAGRNGRRHVQAGTSLPPGRWRCDWGRQKARYSIACRTVKRKR
jgi:hypothetical protein